MFEYLWGPVWNHPLNLGVTWWFKSMLRFQFVNVDISWAVRKFRRTQKWDHPFCFVWCQEVNIYQFQSYHCHLSLGSIMYPNIFWLYPLCIPTSIYVSIMFHSLYPNIFSLQNNPGEGSPEGGRSERCDPIFWNNGGALWSETTGVSTSPKTIGAFGGQKNVETWKPLKSI